MGTILELEIDGTQVVFDGFDTLQKIIQIVWFKP